MIIECKCGWKGEYKQAIQSTLVDSTIKINCPKCYQTLRKQSQIDKFLMKK